VISDEFKSFWHKVRIVSDYIRDPMPKDLMASECGSLAGSADPLPPIIS